MSNLNEIIVTFDDIKTDRLSLAEVKPKVTSYILNVQRGRPLSFINNDIPFEHVLVSLYDPDESLIAVFTLKTKELKFHIPFCHKSGHWKLSFASFHPIKGKANIFWHQGSIDKDSHNIIVEFDAGVKSKLDKPRWFRGDFHMHTFLSDGKESPQDVDKLCSQGNLDTYAITDHNIVVSGVNVKPIYSTELTLDDNGHVNFIGLKSFIDINGIAINEPNTSSVLNTCILTAIKQSALVSLNHPFCPHTGARYPIDLSKFDTIEVCRHFRVGRWDSMTYKATLLFDSLLFLGYRIFAIGGSDFHSKNQAGSIPSRPTTHFYSDDLHQDSVVDALKRGNSYITNECEIEFKIENITSGEVVIWGSEVLPSTELLISVQSSILLKWRLFRNGVLNKSLQVEHAKFKFVVNDGDVIRIDGVDDDNNIRVFFNPLFSGTREQKNIDWLKLRDKIEVIGNSPEKLDIESYQKELLDMILF